MQAYWRVIGIVLQSAAFLCAVAPGFANNALQKPYKISVLAFHYFPSGHDNNTAPQVLAPWSAAYFKHSILITPQTPTDATLVTDTTLLPLQDSTLNRLATTLTHEGGATLLYHAAWRTSFAPEEIKTFHLQDSGFDAMLQVQRKYYFNIHWKSQWRLSEHLNTLYYDRILSLEDNYQAPSNQVQYIDSPDYGVFIEVTRLP